MDMNFKLPNMKKLFVLFLISGLLTITLRSQSQSISFADPVDISQESVAGVTSLDAADFNQDGLLDVIVMEGGKHAEKPTFAWFEQKRNREWIRHELGHQDQLDSFLGSAKCADMDGDQDIDLVVTSDNHAVGPIKVFWFENPGKKNVYKSWKPYLITTIEGFHANDMRIADMDHDGKMDVIIRHKSPNTIRILLQNKEKDWKVISLSTEKLGTEGFAVGKLNGDEMLDISTNGYWFKAPANPGSGEYTLFAIDTTYTKINPNTKEDIGDINGDGFNDIIISPAEAYGNGKDHVLAWYQAPENPENEKAWVQHIIKDSYNNAHTVKLVDIDNDNDLDVISGQAWPPQKITIFFNNQADFSKSYTVIEGKGIYSGAIKDMDQDGDFDIVGEDTYSKASRPWYYENLMQSSKK